MSRDSKFQSVITQMKIDIRELRSLIGSGTGGGGTTTPATETEYGIIEIANQSEADAGTDNFRAITPLRLKDRLLAYAQPLNSNLTSLAGVVSGATGRSLLTAATAAAAKTTLALTKTDVGLANVDNTADTAKPVSTAQQAALNLKADTTSLPTKTSLGLGNVDNTADIDKPVSTAQQTALNLKADTTALPTKTSLGLANVDNTSDVNKPVSTAQQTALSAKANLASPALTGTPTAPTATAGTSTTQLATTAFVAAATSTALTSVPASSETVSGILELATQAETDTGTDDARAVTPLKFQTRLAAFAQPLSSSLTTLAGVTSGTTGRALLTAATAAAAKTTLALVKADVGLANVDNTSDVNKPVSTAQQTALNLKADTTALPTKSSLGLGNVDNTSDINKPVSTAQQTALNLKANRTANLVGFGQLENHGTYTDFNAITDFGYHYVQGTANGPDIPGGIDQYYCVSLSLGAEHVYGSYVCQIAYKRGVPSKMAMRFREGGSWGSWDIVGRIPTKAEVGLGNVDNTSDAAKPISTAQQAALNLKADITALPTKTSLGLGNVDNTSDVNKPVSTAQQAALNLKANIASPNLTGVPTAPTALSGTATDQIASTSYVQAAMGDLSNGMVGIIDGGGPPEGAPGSQGLNDGGIP